MDKIPSIGKSLAEWVIKPQSNYMLSIRDIL